MSGNDGADEFRMVWRGGMMRRQRLRPRTKYNEHRNDHPGRDDHTPSRGKPIVELRFGFGFDTVQHATTLFGCIAANRAGPALTESGLGHGCHAVHINLKAGVTDSLGSTSAGGYSIRTSSAALAPA
jgi:hypothetical protein